MTKRLIAVVLCLLASLAFASVAQAKGPSYSSAQKLAKRLALKQVSNRDIVSFHVLKGTRTARGDIRFPYDDRSVQNVYCTATIVVSEVTRSTGTFGSGRFVGQRCNRIPDDALAFEAAVRAAQRSLRTTALATNDALDRFNASAKPCKRLTIPRARRADAAELIAVGATQTLERPNDTILGNFVAALGQITTADAVLNAGAAGWTDYLAVLRALPDVSDPCAALQSWKRHSWSPSAPPVDFSALRTLDARSAVDGKAIVKAANRLASEGVFPTSVVGFTPKGLLLGLAPKVGITGGN